MPSGVEHNGGFYFGKLELTPITAAMPSGVEHSPCASFPAVRFEPTTAAMPSGVEHLLMLEIELGASPPDHRLDALGR